MAEKKHHKAKKPAAKASPKPVLGELLLEHVESHAASAADASERQQTVNRSRLREGESEISPRAITWRKRSTRKIHLDHALELAEAIRVLGLLQAPAISKSGVLVDGGHRLMAVLLLDTKPEERLAFLESMKSSVEFEELSPKKQAKFAEGLPALIYTPQPVIRVNRLEHEADDVEYSLSAEVFANVQRKEYTRDELIGLAGRLKEEGYSFKRGRRAEGEKAISGQRLLELVSGKSATTLWRLLNAVDKDGNQEERPRRAPSIRPATFHAWVAASEDKDVLRALLQNISARLQALGD